MGAKGFWVGGRCSHVSKGSSDVTCSSFVARTRGIMKMELVIVVCVVNAS